MTQPNLVILHCDELRYDSLNCLGNARAWTPNIDRLAASGTSFTRHMTANPVCMPSRASFFTGLYPPGHGVATNGIPLNRREYFQPPEGNLPLSLDRLVPGPPTLADVFADRGYDTAGLGKFHFRPTFSAADVSHPEDGHRPTEWFDDWAGPYYGFGHVQMTLGHGEQPATRPGNRNGTGCGKGSKKRCRIWTRRVSVGSGRGDRCGKSRGEDDGSRSQALSDDETKSGLSGASKNYIMTWFEAVKATGETPVPLIFRGGL